MGLIKGQSDFKKWQKGERVSRQEAIEANCYECNGGENEDCKGEKTCTLYKYSQFSRASINKRVEKAENRAHGEILAP